MSSPAKPHPNNAIALFCTLNTSSSSSRARTLDLLSTGISYYRSPKAQCTTWSYFLPSTRPKAPSQLVSNNAKDTVVLGMEIYSDKQALQTQQSEQWYKEFGRVSKEESLFNDKGEELVAWYPAAGFVARDQVAEPCGKGTVVMIAVFTCKEGGRDKVVETIGKYTEWVKQNEPGVLTYCTMVRPKEPNKVLLFERYQDHKALGAHGSTKEFKGMFKGIAPNIEVKQTILQECMEINGAFVSNVIGIDETKRPSKL